MDNKKPLINNKNYSILKKNKIDKLKEYKLSTNLLRVVVYAKAKAEYQLHKKIIFGIMGGIFVGMAYLAYVTFLSWSDGSNISNIVTRIGGSMIFPVGIIAIIFLGGNLFTSNCLISLSTKLKVVRKRDFAQDLVVVFFSNLLGAIIFGLIMGLVGTYAENDFTKTLIETATRKLESIKYSTFYTTFFSGILCNILVAGSIFVFTILGENKGLGTFVVYILIFVFAVFGFQHVVANMVIFSAVGFASLLNGFEIGSQPFLENNIDWHGVSNASDFFFRVFLINFPLSSIGNLIGGILICEVYFYAEAEKLKRIQGIDISKQISHLQYQDEKKVVNEKN